MTESRLIYGTFKEEIKNRFLCQVTIDGEDIECYIPSSCRLSNFIDLRGKTVLLKSVQAKNARTKYAVYAVKSGKRFILLNLSQPNQIIAQNLQNRRFSFLGSRKKIYREHTIDGFKSDIFIEDTNTIIEIKSILSFQNEALFPTVYSERSIQQLYQLLSFQERGYRVCHLFVSLNDQVKTICLNRDIGEYGRLLNRCLEKGMLCQGFSLKLKNNIPTISSLVQIKI